MTKWLTVIGMGEDGYDGLSAKAQLVLQNTDVIVGSTRLLGFLPKLKAEQIEWPQPFSAVVEQIKPLRGRNTVILATGDPMNYGVTRKLLEFIPFEEMTVLPHLSAFSHAASRMGWSLPECDTLTLHGRDVENIEAFIQPGARLIVLTADALTIPLVATMLTQRGFQKSKITVLENMVGERESISHHVADTLPPAKFSDLNTLAIECIAGRDALIWSRVGGLPDDAFMHDGQLTKREVRSVTLSALAPAPDQVLWDIGAGCGSVGIEWMRSTRGCHAIAFEHNDDRLKMIGHNVCQLGTPRLKIVAGKAPGTLQGQTKPDAVFIGGGVGIPGVFETAWEHLKPGGRMVANVVTIEGEMHLYDLQEKHGGDLVRMEISNLTQVGPYRALKPRMAVTQWRTIKPW
jgi:precorrin-6B C5,15-methyltransferase / cobalt-precorrin-6B C5,C15-methyltransferase